MENNTSDRSRAVFGNRQPDSVYRKALQSREKHAGPSGAGEWFVQLEENLSIGEALGVRNMVPTHAPCAESPDRERGMIIGSIRMGYGHTRTAIAMASCAHALNYIPYWLELNAAPQTPAAVRDDLYSGNPAALSQNAIDQKIAELSAPLFRNIPKDIPVVATHAWAAQAANHGGMESVVNAIPDNSPMAVHLAEGSLHLVQTHSAYQGYRILNGLEGSRVLNPMPQDALACVGHYVDHELVENISGDCRRRSMRKTSGAPLRFLLSLDSAGMQKEFVAAILKSLRPAVQKRQAAVYVNLGDRRSVWEDLCRAVPGLKGAAQLHFNDWENTRAFCAAAAGGETGGVHVFCHANVLQAVYTTNLLMRSADVLITDPCELAFYPIPKLLLPHIREHERWNAVHSAEQGDGTIECMDIPHILQMLELFLHEDTLLLDMCENIAKNGATGIYDGAYWAVRLAMKTGEA